MHDGSHQRGITYWPEFCIAVFSILLNWPWEFLQVPFCSGMPTAEHWEGIKTCSRAALGDAVIMLVAYWAAAAVAGRYWLLRPTVLSVAIFVGVGVAITVVIERLAVSGGWIATWAYSERMLMVPLLGIGLLPFMQWIVLPPLVLWFSKRQLGRHLIRSDA